MIVKTFVAPSPIHGLGSFAKELIPAGAIYWRFTKRFDGLIRKADVPPEGAEWTRTYCHSLGDDYLMVFPDDARFTNHSDHPNTLVRGIDAIAIRDIQPGEEITEDYEQAERALTAFFLCSPGMEEAGEHLVVEAA
jgi:hypothetical protein